MSEYRPRSFVVGQGEVPLDTGGKPLAVADPDDLATSDELERMRCTLQTLQGRVESLERSRTVERDERQKVRRAIGQLAAAFGFVTK